WALQRFEAIRALVGALPVKNPTILDLGCGPGFYTEKLAELGTATGVDLSEGAIAMARARAPHGTFLAADTYEMPRAGGRFDVVVSQEVLSHVQDQAGYLRRAAYALKPGGYLIISTDNKFVMDRLGQLPWQEFPPEHIDRFVDARTLRELLRPRFRILSLTTLNPVGNGGILRVVNSAKLNRALGLLISPARLARLKERAGLGLTIVALAQKRESVSR